MIYLAKQILKRLQIEWTREPIDEYMWTTLETPLFVFRYDNTVNPHWLLNASLTGGLPSFCVMFGKRNIELELRVYVRGVFAIYPLDWSLAVNKHSFTIGPLCIVYRDRKWR